MTEEQFDICINFHLELIRTKPSGEVISDTKASILNGVLYINPRAIDRKHQSKRKIKTLLFNLTVRYISLISWARSTRNNKLNIYSLKNKSSPSEAVFNATLNVIDGAEIKEVYKEFKINYQCIKALKPRIERWDKYSKLLIDTLEADKV